MFTNKNGQSCINASSIIKFPESSLCVALILKSSPCLIKIRVPLLCEVPIAKNESPLQAPFFPLFFNLVSRYCYKFLEGNIYLHLVYPTNSVCIFFYRKCEHFERLEKAVWIVDYYPPSRMMINKPIRNIILKPIGLICSSQINTIW